MSREARVGAAELVRRRRQLGLEAGQLVDVQRAVADPELLGIGARGEPLARA